jgi:DNA helicase-2/ATP-dependent DNA helicase PcrA
MQTVSQTGSETAAEAESRAAGEPGYLAELNSAQRAAVIHGQSGGPDASPPLLIIAGAGSGKTNTLAHRVAHLIARGADPDRILLLTFSRRAAAEMTRRAQHIVAATKKFEPGARSLRSGWSGTFHGIANRLLRLHADSVGLDPAFTVLDRSDSADLMNLLRNELGLSKTKNRFPQKSTCLAIYSHTVNSQHPLEETLAAAFPWCEAWASELNSLFAAYVGAKQQQNLLDYDDLLLYWHYMMSDPGIAQRVASRFDHVLVDEYQDTNALQATILMGLKPDGVGLTVVGDDAQSIYAFRAATVRNILDFPQQFDPPARVIALEENYRSTQPILEACNAVIDGARERFTKRLFSSRKSHQYPLLVTAEDEGAQVDYVVERVLAHREAGIPLMRQAVLFRTSHHSDALEVELGRRDIPFVKFGGLKFLEAAHVKDALCILRWAENPRDSLAAFRVLQLLPGVGPGYARRAMTHLGDQGFGLASLESFRPPLTAAEEWPKLCGLLNRLGDPLTPWPGQLELVRKWYEPQLERIYDSAHVRLGDLEQLEQISSAYPSRERFLSELTLDPPSACGDEAGAPHLDEDYLILSTIHSAKGQEWDVVYVLNAADGCIPSDMSTGDPEQIEEERRLLYVAMTRSRDHLYLIHPLRFFIRQQHRGGNRHVYTPRSRFLPSEILQHFERRSAGPMRADESGHAHGQGSTTPRIDVAGKLREMWS